MQEWTVIFALIVFLVVTASHVSQQGIKSGLQFTALPLETVMLRVFAASSIPTGILLIICAFDKKALEKANEVPLYVAVAGLMLIFLSIKQLFEPAKFVHAKAGPPHGHPAGQQPTTAGSGATT